jgi:hypothetical protein
MTDFIAMAGNAVKLQRHPTPAFNEERRNFLLTTPNIDASLVFPHRKRA